MYDKYEDLEILTEIIRENFEDEYYIAVCSKHEDFEEEIENRKIDIDKTISGEEIFYRPELKREEPYRGQINLTSRILDSFKSTCKACLEQDCEYIIHLHADAWPMNEGRIKKIIQEMKERNRAVALRGRGSSYRKPDHWNGFIMDQFMFFDSEIVEERDLFDFSPLDLFPHASVHNSILTLLLGRIGRSGIYYYSDMSEDKHWDGEQVEPPYTTVRPSIKEENYDLIHVATDEFPSEEHGKAVQAKYLNEYNLRGEFIEEFISNYQIDGLSDKLRSIEKRQDRKLRFLGFRPKTFGRQFYEKERVLSQSKAEKVSTLARNIIKGIYFRSHEFLFKYSPVKDRNFTGGRKSRKLYKDSEWPDKNMTEIYRESINTSDFPKEFEKDFWFQNE